MINPGQTTRLSDSQQQIKRTCPIVDFAVPADHKESKKRDKCQNLAREHESNCDTNCNWCA